MSDVSPSDFRHQIRLLYIRQIDVHFFCSGLARTALLSRGRQVQSQPSLLKTFQPTFKVAVAVHRLLASST